MPVPAPYPDAHPTAYLRGLLSRVARGNRCQFNGERGTAGAAEVDGQVFAQGGVGMSRAGCPGSQPGTN